MDISLLRFSYLALQHFLLRPWRYILAAVSRNSTQRRYHRRLFHQPLRDSKFGLKIRILLVTNRSKRIFAEYKSVFRIMNPWRWVLIFLPGALSKNHV